jgi:hypothetical protein
VRWIFFYVGFGAMTNLALLGSIDLESWLCWLLFLTWPAAWFAVAFIALFGVYLFLTFIVWVLTSFGEISLIRAWNKRRTDKRIRKYLRARARS